MASPHLSRFTTLLAAFLLATTPAWADSILWMNGADGFLWRSDLNGANAQAVGELTPFPLTHQGGIAVHNGKIYWGSAGNYYSANLDATNQEPIAIVPEPVRVKLLRGVLDSSGNEHFAPPGPLVGDGEEEGGLPTFSPPASIAFDNVHGKLYWAGGWNNLNAGVLQRSNLDGSNVQTLYTGDELHFEDYTIDIEVDPIGGMIYWTGNSSWLARAPLDGGVEPQIIIPQGSFQSMELVLTIPEPASLLFLPAAALIACRRNLRKRS
jgi:hypothetical protein